jgi:hypothetical protein
MEDKKKKIVKMVYLVVLAGNMAPSYQPMLIIASIVLARIHNASLSIRFVAPLAMKEGSPLAI